ncbi:MAG: Gfo/Idh/MocA family protein, partial [Planctomycetota bacterium]
VSDMRRVLDDSTVDAVLIATPDHWHAPAALLACAAGKHVYVEKPCSHNIREGQMMIDAARRADRVMQVGSQSRSTTMIRNAIDLVRGGAIGKLLVAKAWNSQLRKDIGHEKPSQPPPGFDYDLWVGPAPMRPFQSNCHHYTWHWWFDFGTGDAGNDGVHEIDIALWALGAASHPLRVSGHGSKLAFDDDQQFPDTQYVTFEFPFGEGERRLLVYEQRIWSPYVQEGMENGNAFYGTEGYLILSKHEGWRLFGKKNELLKEEKGEYSVPQHAADFIDAIRTGRRPSADIEIGHRCATLCHMANILARTGRGSLDFDAKSEAFVGAPEANALLKRTYREGHWAVPRGV